MNVRFRLKAPKLHVNGNLLETGLYTKLQTVCINSAKQVRHCDGISNDVTGVMTLAIRLVVNNLNLMSQLFWNMKFMICQVTPHVLVHDLHLVHKELQQ